MTGIEWGRENGRIREERKKNLKGNPWAREKKRWYIEEKGNDSVYRLVGKITDMITYEKTEFLWAQEWVRVD